MCNTFWRSECISHFHHPLLYKHNRRDFVMQTQHTATSLDGASWSAGTSWAEGPVSALFDYDAISLEKLLFKQREEILPLEWPL